MRIINAEGDSESVNNLIAYYAYRSFKRLKTRDSRERENILSHLPRKETTNAILFPSEIPLIGDGDDDKPPTTDNRQPPPRFEKQDLHLHNFNRINIHMYVCVYIYIYFFFCICFFLFY